jgi:transcriptional regulator GlxA family with amidase domain
MTDVQRKNRGYTVNSPKRDRATPNLRPADLSVGFVLLPDFTLLAFSGFVDALRIAADQEDRSRQVHCQWTILGPRRIPVRSSSGVEITPWETFDEDKRFDYVIVIGGLLRGHERMDRRILSFLRDADARGVSLVGVCTGSFALARAGLMKGYRACVHWYHLEEFTREFPKHRAEADVAYRVDGRRITCAGGQSALDVALHLVERHCGRKIASKVRTALVVTAAHGPRQPPPHPETKWFAEINKTLVQRAILLIDEQPAWRPGLMPEIASRLGVSVRTLVRGFESTFNLPPAAFFRVLRVARGRWDLLNTSKPIGSIALDHGFSDASHFTRLFREYYGATPASFRQTAGSSASTKPVAKAWKAAGRVGSPIEQILYGDAFSLAAVDWPQ